MKVGLIVTVQTEVTVDDAEAVDYATAAQKQFAAAYPDLAVQGWGRCWFEAEPVPEPAPEPVPAPVPEAVP
jgi:hypothetical protein